MSRRRLIPLALVVTALLAVVAIAARGHPLGKGSGEGKSGAGLPRTFWDYLFSTFVVLEVVLIVFALVAVFFFRRERAVAARYNPRTLRALVTLILVAALISYVARHVTLKRFHLARPATTRTPSRGPGHNTNPSSPIQHLHFQWEVLVIVLVLLLALGAAAWFTRARLGPERRWRRTAPETLAAALDESLDDLRNDPDLRRAIIAAYARMETALAAAGIPRHPAEAPLEYLERALLTLDASASAVRRLTDLFEWARFSHHEPEPSMRDEAIDALVAVRDELRASELTPA